MDDPHSIPSPSDYHTAAESVPNTAANSPLVFATPNATWTNNSPITDKDDQDTTPTSQAQRIPAAVSERLRGLHGPAQGHDGYAFGNDADATSMSPTISSSSASSLTSDVSLRTRALRSTHPNTSKRAPPTRPPVGQDDEEREDDENGGGIPLEGVEKATAEDETSRKRPSRKGRRRYKNMQLKKLPADHPKRKAARRRRGRGAGKKVEQIVAAES